MFHYYSFKNFQSFRERAIVSFALGKQAGSRGWERDSKSGERLSTALGVFGANAAGKTALLKPLSFVSWFVASSFSAPADDPVFILPHYGSKDEPFEFEMQADHPDTGELYKYELVATTTRVLREALYKKQTRFSYVFIRTWNEARQDYDVKQQGFGLSPVEARKVRQNASLISTAKQYGVNIEPYTTPFSSITTNINVVGRVAMHKRRAEDASKVFARFDKLRLDMVQLLKQWDLGLSDVELKESEKEVNGEKESRWTWVGVHKNSKGKEFRLPMELESSGTQSAYVLLSLLLMALTTGGMAIIDEMESDLHPLLVPEILNLFADENSNPLGAQLLFTCHSMTVLDVLTKSQVIFIEKNDCESEAYRGDEIKGLRSDDNLRAKYETGALGGVPRT